MAFLPFPIVCPCRSAINSSSGNIHCLVELIEMFLVLAELLFQSGYLLHLSLAHMELLVGVLALCKGVAIMSVQ